MIMPTTGKRNTTRDQSTLLGTGRLDLKISTVAPKVSCRTRKVGLPGEQKYRRGLELTPGDDVQYQNYEADNTSSGARLRLRQLLGILE